MKGRIKEEKLRNDCVKLNFQEKLKEKLKGPKTI